MFEGFYFITDSNLSRLSHLEQARKALEGGARLVQYREKQLPLEEMLEEAREIKNECDARIALFIVNDWPELALAVGASAVHVGQKDALYEEARKAVGGKGIVGVSASSVEEAVEAASKGADYIGLGPIYATSTKKDASPPGGLQLIQETRASVSLPLIAIGGITLENVSEVIAAGADGAAAISDVLRSNDIALAVKRFQESIASAREK